MLRLLAFLWTGCFHKWETTRKIEVYEHGESMPYASKYHLRCQRCGTVKCKRLA